MISRLIDRRSESNPQLFRELKGRLQPRQVSIAVAVSLVGQLLIFLYYEGLLPTATSSYNRYCTASSPPNAESGYSYWGSNYCIQDLQGNWMILRELWWLDIFTCISVIGIFALLVVGTYLLISDLSKEERQGTLNFIRLSPQSAKEVAVGKILGVPILLYLVSALALPLHLTAGLSANIPLTLILAFYGVLIASCAFFYTAALVFSLISGGLAGFQAWLGSGTVLFFLFMATGMTMSGYSGKTPLDWLLLFYPGTVLPYLAHSTFLPAGRVGYHDVRNLHQLLWYGLPLWRNAWSGIGFIVLHYGLWTYWLSKALKRRFHNPLATLLSKPQSYWITGSFILISVGFALQTSQINNLFGNFAVLQMFVILFFLGLMIALSPHRQALQDWSRYRHQENIDRRSLLKELILGEKSPSTLAIALNLGIVVVFLTPIILLSPLEDKLAPTLAGLFLAVNMILIYAAISQLVLLLKTPKRVLAAASIVGTMIILPLLCFGMLRIMPNEEPLLWSFSVLPIVATEYAKGLTVGLAMLGQWITLSLISLQMTRQLRLVGKSETKALLSGVR